MPSGHFSRAYCPWANRSSKYARCDGSNIYQQCQNQTLIVEPEHCIQCISASPRAIVNCFQALLNPSSQIVFPVALVISHYLYTIAYPVNDAIDHIQQQPDTNSPIIIHTGTNNIRNESSKRTIQRFQRLEVNLRAKGYQHVALSEIIFRGDHHNRRKTLAVNKEIENICIRNQ